MVYLFLRSRVVIDPADPERIQHLTHAHYFPVPTEEAHELNMVLVDRYCFCSVPSDIKEELAAKGFDRELGWDVVEVMTPTEEEWQASRAARMAEAMQIPISECLPRPVPALPEGRFSRLTAPLCPPADPDPADRAQADIAASAVILGELSHRCE